MSESMGTKDSPRRQKRGAEKKGERGKTATGGSKKGVHAKLSKECHSNNPAVPAGDRVRVMCRAFKKSNSEHDSNQIADQKYTVEPPLRGHPWDKEKSPLNGGVP
ncbi:hypothetical protein OS493_022021 [Desmophyllum pertusum]|uniref:Uncharacterized protein n=1 Tax=Desmophyllum pertusum TaxID=174260 RepID=A0A9X0CRU9_9CNID|nr:hypothetical protein OS493_022021 [Desmophyllum pertusum]